MENSGFPKTPRNFVAISAGIAIIPLCLVPRSVGTPGKLHHDSHSKGWPVVKKLLSLLIALCVFAGTAVIIGCGGDEKKEKKEKSSTTDAGKEKGKEKGGN